jgi:hypothetical protein
VAVEKRPVAVEKRPVAVEKRPVAEFSSSPWRLFFPSLKKKFILFYKLVKYALATVSQFIQLQLLFVKLTWYHSNIAYEKNFLQPHSLSCMYHLSIEKI